MKEKYLLAFVTHLKENLLLIAYSLLGTFLFTEILGSSNYNHLISDLAYGFVLGLISCAGGKYIFTNPKIKKQQIAAATIVFFAVGFLIANLLNSSSDSLAQILVASFLIFMLTPKEVRKQDSIGVHWIIAVLSAIGTSITISMIMLALVAILITIIESLFGIKIFTYLQNFGLAFFLVFMPVNLFAIFSPDEKKIATFRYVMPPMLERTLRVLIQPIMFLYVLVLLAYAIKILFRFELPVGMVSMPIGIAYSLFFLLTTYLESQGKEKEGVWKYHGWIALSFFPLLVMMGIGIFRRLGDYGLTDSRFYLLLAYFLILVSYALRIIYKRAELRKLMAISALALALTSIGPLSPRTLSVQNQAQRFLHIVEQYHRGYQKLEDFKLTTWKLSDIQAASSALSYLNMTKGVDELIQKGLSQKIFVSTKTDGTLDFNIEIDLYSAMNQLSGVGKTYAKDNSKKKIDDRVCKIFSMPYKQLHMIQRVSGFDWYYEFSISGDKAKNRKQLPGDSRVVVVNLEDYIVSVNSEKKNSTAISFADAIRNFATKTSVRKTEKPLELTGTVQNLKIKLQIERAEIDCAEPSLSGKIFLQNLN